MSTNWKKLKADQDQGKEPAGVEEFISTAEQIADASYGSASTNKQTLSIRLDPEIIRYFKSLGPRYQTRINEVLLAHVRSQKAVAKDSVGELPVKSTALVVTYPHLGHSMTHNCSILVCSKEAPHAILLTRSLAGIPLVAPSENKGVANKDSAACNVRSASKKVDCEIGVNVVMESEANISQSKLESLAELASHQLESDVQTNEYLSSIGDCKKAIVDELSTVFQRFVSLIMSHGGSAKYDSSLTDGGELSFRAGVLRFQVDNQYAVHFQWASDIASGFWLVRRFCPMPMDCSKSEPASSELLLLWHDAISGECYKTAQLAEEAIGWLLGP